VHIVHTLLNKMNIIHCMTRRPTTLRVIQSLQEDAWRRVDMTTLADEVGVSRRAIIPVVHQLMRARIVERRGTSRSYEYHVDADRALEADLL